MVLSRAGAAGTISNLPVQKVIQKISGFYKRFFFKKKKYMKRMVL